MPKGKKGGKNKKRAKKNRGPQLKRELIFKEEGQDYAQVIKMLGNGRLEAKCSDGKQRLCHIRGKFRKRVWINVDDIILLGLRDFEDDKADVIHKYTPDEARTLRAYEELPSGWLVGGGGGVEQEEDTTGVAFGDVQQSFEDEEEDDLSEQNFEELLQAL